MNRDRVGLSTARLYTEPVCVVDLHDLPRSKARDWDLSIYRLCQMRYDYFIDLVYGDLKT